MSASPRATLRHRASPWAFALAVMCLGPWAAAANPLITEGDRLLEDWQLEDALGLAKKALTASPDDPEVWAFAGRVQHQRGEHLSALDLLDAAAREGVQTGHVHARVAASAAYAAHFSRLDTDHFSIRYLNKDEIVAHYAAPVLEAAYRRIGDALEFHAAERGEKIVVEIYPDARGLAGATGLTVDEIATSGTIAVCKFHRLMITSPLATADGYGWADTIAHELIHLIVSKKSNNTIPIWLHEGIAKYYESLWKGGPGESLAAYSEKLLADATKSGKLITFQQMHPSMAKLPSQEDAALAFAEVFATIEMLVGRFGPNAIPKILEKSGQGLPLERALKDVVKMDLAGIEANLGRYLAKRKFRVVPGAAPTRITLATEERSGQDDEGSGLEDIEDQRIHNFARLGELLQLRGHHKAAVVEYEKAYALASVRYPSLNYRLAKAYAATQQPKQALDVLDKTLQVHPEDGDLRLIAGRLHLEAGRYGEAQAHFEAVRHQNPFNPEIHGALAALYDKKGEATKAEQERHFLQLSSKPRPTRIYELPSPPSGSARVSIVTPGWDRVRIDGQLQLSTPVWERPMEAGEHVIEGRDSRGELVIKRVELTAGSSSRIIFP